MKRRDMHDQVRRVRLSSCQYDTVKDIQTIAVSVISPRGPKCKSFHLRRHRASEATHEPL